VSLKERQLARLGKNLLALLEHSPLQQEDKQAPRLDRIVNVARVREIQTMFSHQSVAILTDGTRVRLARGKRSQLEELLERGNSMT